MGLDLKPGHYGKCTVFQSACLEKKNGSRMYCKAAGEIERLYEEIERSLSNG